MSLSRSVTVIVLAVTIWVAASLPIGVVVGRAVRHGAGDEAEPAAANPPRMDSPLFRAGDRSR